MKFLLWLSVLCLLVACQKTGGIPGKEKEKAPEWRVTELITVTENIKLAYGYDTSTITYDSLGRFLKMYNRFLLRQPMPYNYPTYYESGAMNVHFEYIGNTEKMSRITYTDVNGSPSSSIQEFFYDQSNTRVLKYIFKSFNGPRTYDFKYGNSDNKPTGFVDIEYPHDTAVNTLKYDASGNLAERKILRYAGTEEKLFTYQYNSEGNPVFHRIMSVTFGDTMRQIKFNWMPSITSNRVKMFDKSFQQMIYEWGNFYFPSYNTVTEIDYFDLTANNQLMTGYDFNWNRFTIMANKLNFTYELDSNQNIGKIYGQYPGSTKVKVEMKVKYEKVK